MKRALQLLRDPRGATMIEFAFALPILILFIWVIYQFGLIFRANSGIQHALGQGARMATLWPTPSNNAIADRMEDSVYGIGPGDFTFSVALPGDDPSTPANETITGGYKDLTVTYTQDTNLIIFPGPTVNVRKTKRVWVAGSI